ncbi:MULTISPECIES: type II toxin-antitoxin system RelE/ParE family toxin [unclassified Wenzhouxiangella]|uniref:type II toxin-antitoxin system RelE/ParE family toxin n=1 Tax=unclassified Wenzhouxiangella TaxID=2613841 RepID=UPI000E328DE7|nr:MULTISPECIES: type II toxin-antitoxin system RelE/ParE family toxin [unclassified Wenzhouxiangella]RFF28546.1 type II toxin-antitoxin system RelE/ParE family toxin [Wenzhouxiangella sp. 15181]RFP70065.1 type II toxin-antitoxin system RelE/ParE family toxin [Wenzhouxiangella sp. 15190]
MTVLWSAEAKSRLAAIHEHVANDSPLDAEALIRRLIDRVVQLESAPHSGRRVPEYPDTNLRELLSRPYRIIYRQGAEYLEVVTVMHYRQQLPGNPQELRSP